MTTMTVKRLEILLDALTRGADEWEAEAADLDRYGDGPHPDDRADLAKLRARISTLESARSALVEHFPRQAGASQRKHAARAARERGAGA